MAPKRRNEIGNSDFEDEEDHFNIPSSLKSENLDDDEEMGGEPELFKSEFSDSEVEQEDGIETEEVDDEDEMPPPMEDELMSNPLMSDLSSLNNPPPSNSQTQHKSHYDLPSSLVPPDSEMSHAYNDYMDEGVGTAATENVPGFSENLTEIETAGHSLAEILTIDKFRRRIARDYQRFLTTFTDENGHSVYHARIKAMCSANYESLEVSYLHLVEANAFLAKLVANVPAATLEIFDEATMRIVLRLFEDYDRIKSEIHVRITDFPSMDQLRDLRYNHLNTLVRVSGVVTRRSGVFPQLKMVKYDCGRCHAILGPFVQDLNEEIKINSCSECEARGPFTVNASQTVYRNYQKITLQEAPGSVPAGRLPRHKDVILLWDLIDAARPGEMIEVTGIYRNNFSYTLNLKNGFPVFATIIEAIHISKKEDQFAEYRLTEDDQKEIRRLSEDPLIGLRIIRSIAPSIYGHNDIKTAIALSLFAGVPKNVQGKHPIRGDINVLMLGDPGTAKSQFLKYIEKTAHRAVFTTGQGASAVGLTASVRKDPVTREWTLEGGALVLADKGVCLIDEFDKMNDSDRTSIHEAMEQQSISISKAGIVTTLQARCAIIAAANPTRGRYNPSIPFSQNVNLTEPILSRFDILCVVKDMVDPIIDEKLARFVVGSHARSHPSNTYDLKGHDTELDDIILDSLQLADNLQTSLNPVEPISQDMLKKYMLYAKTRIRPELSQLDVDKISKLYADLRKESMQSGSIPITVRHIESIVRMSEAHAKMHLRDYVRSDDIDLAIRVMLESFIQSQKYSVMNHLKKVFAKYISYKKDNIELLYFVLQELVRDRLRYFTARNGPDHIPKSIPIEVGDLELRARELNIYDLRPFYNSRLFTGNGFQLDTAQKTITKAL